MRDSKAVGNYQRLNEALADGLFNQDQAGKPVYVLPEREVLEQIVAKADLGTDDPTAAFVSAVRSTLFIEDSGTSPFRWHTLASQRHSSDPLSDPPSLALLVVLSMASDAMHAGDGMSAANYYGRLMHLLDVPHDRRGRVQSAYMAVAELLWGTLNDWLEAWEGERGVPTSYALGQRYIGLPMSQALVRQRDRTALPEIFWSEGLPPGFRMAAPDMEAVLDPFVARVPSPLSQPLRQLWTNGSARERIVQVACLELESWAGDDIPEKSEDGRARRAGAARLLAFVRTFPRAVLELNLSLPQVHGLAEPVHLAVAEGVVTLPTVAGPVGTARLSGVDLLDLSTLLTDKVRGKLDGSELTVERLPRRVIPLRWDELQGCFVEVERVELLEDSIVLAVKEMQPKLQALLEEVARPGFESLADVPGLPDGWVLYRQVQIMRAHSGSIHVDLLPMRPRARTSLTLSGGFMLPGRLRKWSSLQPPEVSASAAGATSIGIRVDKGSRLGEEVLRVDTDGDIAIVPIEGHGLADGEYTVSMYVDDAAKPLSSTSLRLRSADTPLFNMTEVDLQLVYSPAWGALWPLSAGPVTDQSYVNGARVVGGKKGDSPVSPMPEFAPRQKTHTARHRRLVRIGTAMPDDSCMHTGKHYFRLPDATPGRPVSRSVEGECRSCGLVKRFPTTAGGAKKRVAVASRSAQLPSLPPVSPEAEADQHIAFDALSHIGHGTLGTFERIAGQIEGSGLFADTFLRRQEVMGHIDVSRDDTLKVLEWAVNAPTLVPVDGDRWMLVGGRSQSLVQSLGQLLDDFGKLVSAIDAGILRVEVIAPRERLLSQRQALNGLGVEILDKPPAPSVASWLPPLSEIERALGRSPVPAYRGLEIWNTSSATWVEATSMAAVGAYRLRNFSSLYVVRSRTDLDAGTVGLGNAYLVKHIANSWAGDPLARYHAKSASVVAPLGADVPGLYGRALALCSGKSPREIPTSRLVQYADVAMAP